MIRDRAHQGEFLKARVRVNTGLSEAWLDSFIVVDWTP
ncbi:unnamed protein product [Acidithrix sp. C25]|nr:unnamed protein product [Acidithrix sp. C25]